MTFYCTDLQTAAETVDAFAGHYSQVKVERDEDWYTVTVTEEEKEDET